MTAHETIRNATPNRNVARLMAMYHYPNAVIGALTKPALGDPIQRLDEMILIKVREKYPNWNVTSIEDERIWK